MSDSPLVSVVISTFNRADLLMGAIESALAQDYVPIEIIVVDDGSSDSTESQIQTFGDRIRYVRQENGGSSAARNHGVDLSRGEYVAFLDDDDLFIKDKLSRQAPILVANPEVALVATQALSLQDPGRPELAWPLFPRQSSGLVPLEELVVTPHTSISPSCSLIRKTAFIEIGGFDRDILFGEDWDLVIRLAAKFGIYYLSDPLVYQRLHGGDRFSTYYFDSAKAGRRYHSHRRIVEKASRLLDENPSDLAQKALACVEVEYAINEIANGHVAAGQERLLSAIKLDPQTWIREGGLENQVALYCRRFLKHGGWKEPQTFIRNVWGPGFPAGEAEKRRLRRRHLGRLALDVAFKASSEGDFPLTRRAGFEALYREPSQIKNRGLLSILTASLLGRQSLAEIRAGRR